MVEKLSLPSPERVVASVNAFKGPRSLMEKIPFLMPESTTPNKYVLAMNPLGTKKIVMEMFEASWYKHYAIWLEVFGVHTSGIYRAIFSPPSDYDGKIGNSPESSYICLRGLPKAKFYGGAALEEVHYLSEDQGRVDSATFGKHLDQSDTRDPGLVRSSFFFSCVPQFEYEKIPSEIDYKKSYDRVVDKFSDLVKMEPQRFDSASLDFFSVLAQ